MRQARLRLAALGTCTALTLTGTVVGTAWASPSPSPMPTGYPGVSPGVSVAPLPSPTITGDITAALRTALTKTASLDTFSGTMSARSQNNEAVATYKYQAKPFKMSVDVQALKLEGQLSPHRPKMVMDGAVLYLNPGGIIPTLQGNSTWWKLDLATLPAGKGKDFAGLITSGKLTDPVTIEKAVAAYSDAKVVGQVMIEGVSATHYTATYDANVALAAVGLPLPTASPMAEMKTLKTDVWVDPKNLVRRIEYTSGSDVLAATVLAPDTPVTIEVPTGTIKPVDPKMLEQFGY